MNNAFQNNQQAFIELINMSEDKFAILGMRGHALMYKNIDLRNYPNSCLCLNSGAGLYKGDGIYSHTAVAVNAFIDKLSFIQNISLDAPILGINILAESLTYEFIDKYKTEKEMKSCGPYSHINPIDSIFIITIPAYHEAPFSFPAEKRIWVDYSDETQSTEAHLMI